mmetsp:Transcript_21362/g.67229  ORF Transcript_21362/g.67229 Transcript_21362/m.67229 type:complete len:240 (-) Transcript_21362:686-1405(-)
MAAGRAAATDGYWGRPAGGCRPRSCGPGRTAGLGCMCTAGRGLPCGRCNVERSGGAGCSPWRRASLVRRQSPGRVFGPQCRFSPRHPASRRTPLPSIHTPIYFRTRVLPSPKCARVKALPKSPAAVATVTPVGLGPRGRSVGHAPRVPKPVGADGSSERGRRPGGCVLDRRVAGGRDGLWLEAARAGSVCGRLPRRAEPGGQLAVVGHGGVVHDKGAALGNGRWAGDEGAFAGAAVCAV